MSPQEAATPAALCLPYSSLGVEGRRKDGILLVRVIWGTEHAQLTPFWAFSFFLYRFFCHEVINLPLKRMPTTVQLCLDTFNEAGEVLRRPKGLKTQAMLAYPDFTGNKDDIWIPTWPTSLSLPLISFWAWEGKKDYIFWSSPAPQLPTSDFYPILSPLLLLYGWWTLSVKTYENI